jgi:hypothetical protein
MDYDAFKATLSADQPPPGIGDLLRALWLDARGDFDAAHAIAQENETPAGAHLHAYLHRKEGDLPNARYWYQNAGVPVANGSLSAEWEALVRRFSS